MKRRMIVFPIALIASLYAYPLLETELKQHSGFFIPHPYLEVLKGFSSLIPHPSSLPCEVLVQISLRYREK
jgi:hypothetical protein